MGLGRRPSVSCCHQRRKAVRESGNEPIHVPCLVLTARPKTLLAACVSSLHYILHTHACRFHVLQWGHGWGRWFAKVDGHGPSFVSQYVRTHLANFATTFALFLCNFFGGGGGTSHAGNGGGRPVLRCMWLYIKALVARTDVMALGGPPIQVNVLLVSEQPRSISCDESCQAS